MPLPLLFHYLMLKMFRMLIHPSSVACDLFVELFHGLYCSGSMCVGVTLWFGWDGVVSVCRQLLRMDVLTSETCWALNNEIIKQVTSSCSLFIQLTCCLFNHFCSLRFIKFCIITNKKCRDRNSSLLQNVQPGSGSHPPSYSSGIGVLSRD